MLNVSIIRTIKYSIEWLAIIKAFILSVVLEFLATSLLVGIILGLMHISIYIPISWLEGDAIVFLVYAVIYSAAFFYLTRIVKDKDRLRRHFIALAGVIFAYGYIVHVSFGSPVDHWEYIANAIPLLLTSMATGYGLSRLKR